VTTDSTLTKFGFRFGRNGAHAARTMMLGELRTLFIHQPETATKEDYRREVVESNVLGKPTRKARELAFGHLADLYGLAPELAAFRAGSPDELEGLANSASHRGQIVFMSAGGVKEVRFPGYLTPEEEHIAKRSPMSSKVAKLFRPTVSTSPFPGRPGWPRFSASSLPSTTRR
jgi:hypothetical protein